MSGGIRMATAAAALMVMLGAIGTAAGSTVATPTRTAYSLAATTRCLEANGASVARLRPLDTQLRQLRDLAQRTSREARFGGQSVGLAFVESESGATLLVELLTVPNTRYRLDRRRNVVLMYRPQARAAHDRAVGCLRT